MSQLLISCNPFPEVKAPWTPSISGGVVVSRQIHECSVPWSSRFLRGDGSIWYPKNKSFEGVKCDSVLFESLNKSCYAKASLFRNGNKVMSVEYHNFMMKPLASGNMSSSVFRSYPIIKKIPSKPYAIEGISIPMGIVIKKGNYTNSSIFGNFIVFDSDTLLY